MVAEKTVEPPKKKKKKAVRKYRPRSLPWYKSKVIVGALLSITTKVLVASGAISDLSPTDQEQLAEIIVLVVGGIGDALAIGSRVTQKTAPRIKRR